MYLPFSKLLLKLWVKHGLGMAHHLESQLVVVCLFPVGANDDAGILIAGRQGSGDDQRLWV